MRLCWRNSRHMPDRGTLPVSADLKQPGTRRDGPGGVRLLSGDRGENHAHLKSNKKKRNRETSSTAKRMAERV